MLLLLNNIYTSTHFETYSYLHDFTKLFEMMAVYNLLILQTRTRDVQTQEWRERSYYADHERYC